MVIIILIIVIIINVNISIDSVSIYQNIKISICIIHNYILYTYYIHINTVIKRAPEC
jgi:hypothetical protein